MTDFLNIYDLSRKKTAVLQNAFDIVETQELNQIYTLTFRLPASDEKAQYIQAFRYARWGEKGDLYRIVNVQMNESSTGILSVTCEHVIATLCDDLMFGNVQYGGGSVKTPAVISFLLSKQKTQNWQLGACDFDRKFEYGWEQENILNALYAIPREFSSPYKWEFDTSAYPWRLSLKAIDTSIKPEYYIRAKSNLLGSDTAQDFTGICTRIYPLGYGEGVNQLTIKDVNNGVPYLQSPAAIVAQYGIKEKVLVDRRFENAESLKAYGQTMLDNLQTPSMSRDFDVTDLYPLTGAEIDNAKVGQICRMTMDGSTAYITRTVRVLDDPGNLQIELSTKATDVASTIADLADRVRIESVYAQGATQLYQHSKDANATSTKGMILSVYFPDEMKQINKVLLKVELGRFRAYSQATSIEQTKIKTTSSEPAATRTTSSEPAKTQTSSSEPAKTQTSSSQPESTQTSSSQPESSQTSSGGSIDGSTSTSTTGGGTINVTLSGTAAETTDTNWTSGTPYTENTDLDIKVVSNQGEHQHFIDGRVASVEPLPQYNYKHTHYFTEDGAKTAYTEYGGGKHSHEAYVDNGEDNGHHHNIPRSRLAHTHIVPIEVTSNVIGQSGFSHSHTFSVGSHKHTVTIPIHDHTVTIPKHDHTVTIPKHDHTVTIPKHDHTVTIPKHDHTVEIPAHDHTITPGIFEVGTASTAFDIYVSGVKKTTVNATNYDGDITQWLLNAQRQIPRNSWIRVEIRPNQMAYVTSSVFIQGFVQSRGGGNY